MGCGYSKNNSKKSSKLKDQQADVCSDTSDPDTSTEVGSEKYLRVETSPKIVVRSNLLNGTEDSLSSRRRIANKIRPISGPMRPPINRSASQLSFFRMLDEKIANGKDLEEAGEMNEVHGTTSEVVSLIPTTTFVDEFVVESDDVMANAHNGEVIKSATKMLPTSSDTSSSSSSHWKTCVMNSDDGAAENKCKENELSNGVKKMTVLTNGQVMR